MITDINEFCFSMGLDYIIGVPASELSPFFTTKAAKVIITPREDDAVGLACGLSVCNKKTLVVMQSSGIGNCLNALASLAVPYNIPLAILISARGGVHEENEVQRILGEKAEAVLSPIIESIKTIDTLSNLTLLNNFSFNKASIEVLIIHHYVLKQWCSMQQDASSS